MRKIVGNWDEKDYFVEEWVLGESDWSGIIVHSPGFLNNALDMSRANGLSLGDGFFCGYGFEDRVYNHESWFYNGCVVVHGMGKCDKKLLKGYPKRFVRIGAVEEIKVYETARELTLPIKTGAIIEIENR